MYKLSGTIREGAEEGKREPGRISISNAFAVRRQAAEKRGEERGVRGTRTAAGDILVRGAY